ncbi:hypothetical protein [Rufibacter roseus]|uniref:DUF1795 domain-containing protein n=1 Tax=Rufibacter roseus TaxID=1567108 RepID=A0ABW2DL53_9BACT|nr:hypothetical protein [Rufibacter roseus]
MKYLIWSICSLLLLTGFISPTPTDAVDYLSLPGPIKFKDTEFALAWSSHPNASYFKQEYVPAGETVQGFNQMILAEVVVGDFSVEDAVQAQIRTIAERKKTDAVADYEVFENPKTGEVILDFLMSAGNESTVSVVEWNAYKYRPYQDKAGRRGVVLFGYSRRGYNKNVEGFLSSLKSVRSEYLKALGSYSIPDISIKNK